MAQLTLISAPTLLPVTLGTAKAFLRIDHAEEDAKITSMLSAAVGYFDARGILNRCIMPQGWRLDLCHFPSCGEIELPFPDCRDFSISYLDAWRQRQDLISTAYDAVEDEDGTELCRAWGVVWPATGYAPDAVRVTFTAGYADAASVPDGIKNAILFRLSELYQARPDGFKAIIDQLVSPYRYQRLG